MPLGISVCQQRLVEQSDIRRPVHGFESRVSGDPYIAEQLFSAQLVQLLVNPHSRVVAQVFINGPVQLDAVHMIRLQGLERTLNIAPDFAWFHESLVIGPDAHLRREVNIAANIVERLSTIGLALAVIARPCRTIATR